MTNKDALIKKLKESKERAEAAEAKCNACEKEYTALKKEIFGSYDCDCECCYIRCNAREHHSIKKYNLLAKKKDKLYDKYIETLDAKIHLKETTQDIDLNILKTTAIEAMKRAKIQKPQNFLYDLFFDLEEIYMKDHLAVCAYANCSKNTNNELISLQHALESTNVKLKIEEKILRDTKYYEFTFYTEKINYDN